MKTNNEMKRTSFTPVFCTLFFLIINYLNVSSQTVDFIKHYSQPFKFFHANHIIHTSDDCYVMIGSENSFFTNQINNYFIMKTNTIGDTLWYHEDNYPNPTEGKFVIETSDSCYILATNKNQIGLVKFDQLGNFLWEKAMDPYPGSTFNFSSMLEVNQRLYVFGYELTPPNTINNAIMIKLNLNGDSLSAITNTPFTCGRSVHASIKCDVDKIALSGIAFDSTNSIYQTQFSVIDTNGLVLKNQIISTTNEATGLTISGDSIGNFYLMSEGGGSSTYKLDSSGNLIWSKAVAGNYFCKIDTATILLMNENFTYYYLNDSGMFISYNPFDFPFSTNPTHIANVILSGNKIIMGGSSNDASECFIVQYDLSNITDIPGIDIKKNMVLFPNPVSSMNPFINIDASKINVKKLFIYNSQGKLMPESNIAEDGNSIICIPTKSFSKGIYLIKIIDSNESLYNILFLVD